MKLNLLLLITALAVSASAQVVLVDTKNKVTASFETAVKDTWVQRKQTWADAKASKSYAATFLMDGTFTGGEYTVTSETNPQFSQISVIPTGARVLARSNGGTKNLEIPRFDNLSLADPSVLWFAKSQPEKGATARFMNFDPDRRYWEEVTVTYNGRGKLGDSPEGHLVTRKSSNKTVRVLLDDQGDPLVWEEGRLRLVRRK